MGDHDKAKEHYIKELAFVRLKKEQNIIVRIRDNGKGFNLQKIRKGLGFKIFEKRTHELNGILKIKSEIKKETTIEVVFKK